ncbi:MAG: Gfo/Idh/MocA family oxidoreductase [Gammaproteobacteria bacterium]|nr:Gfo/Idh/MocA family oxidoreductase [Gammaproteobacteria bacterium]MCP4879442.1 Gfo/Idh/MocA family oxidoreductase [Gammaproteobacteria bacterium]
MNVRYGLIGTGMMGQEHIRNICLIDGAKVVALSDPDTGMLQAANSLLGDQARTFADHHDMIAADLCDAYIIVAPNDLHLSLLLDLIPTEKPILCEKPLCTTVAGCETVIAAAKGRHAPIWVAMEYRYMPPIQQLLAERDNDRVGIPRMMAIREHRFPFLEKVGDWNRFNARTGGTLVEKCCHFWDLMRLVLQSDPIRVYASAGIDENHRHELYNGHTPDILDNAFVTVDFRNGARGMLDLCMFAEGSYWQEVISLTGAKGRVDACIPGPARFSKDGKERKSQLVISERASKQQITQDVAVDETILSAGDHHGSTYYQHQKFLQLVTTGIGQPEVTIEDALWSVRVGEAAELSAKTGLAITLD